MKKKTDTPTTIEEIQTRLQELRIELHDIAHKTGGGKHKNVHAPRMIKKDIARLMTAKTALEKKA